MTKRIRSTDQNYVELTGEIRHETPRAYLFFDGSIEDWIPRSQVESIDFGSDGTTIVVPEWLAKSKGFI